MKSPKLEQEALNLELKVLEWKHEAYSCAN